MKARITTVLSLTGVLVAGSAAALVNTQVLQNSSANKSTATEISVADQQPESVSSVSTAPEVSVSLPNKLAGVVGVAVTSAGAPTTQESFALDRVGTIVLDKAGDVLTVVSVSPAAGYTVVGQENSDSLNVEIKFLSAEQMVEFKGSLMFGTITPSVETAAVTQPTTENTSRTTTGGTTGGSTGTTTGSTTGGSSRSTTTTSVHHDDHPDDTSGRHGGGGDDD